MKSVFLVTTIISTYFLLSGCTSKKVTEQIEPPAPAVAPTSLNPQYKRLHVNSRDAAVLKDQSVRRGAGEELGSAKHYFDITAGDKSPLITSKVKYDRQQLERDSNVTSALENGTDNASRIMRFFGIGKNLDYSYYNLMRWQRFCNKGKDMDRTDWRFVIQHKDKFPKELIQSCSLPEDKLLNLHGIRL